MSDDKKKDEKKDDKKDAAAPAAPSPITALIGPILAVVVLVGSGIATGMWLKPLFYGEPIAVNGTGNGEDPHTKKNPDDHDPKESHSVLHSAMELDLGPVKSNIAGQGGKRYIIMEVAAWVDKDLSPQLAGGGHGGGPTSIIKILKSSIEEQLTKYQLSDFDNEGATNMLSTDFERLIERDLRSLLDKVPPTMNVVHKVVITGRMMQ